MMVGGAGGGWSEGGGVEQEKGGGGGGWSEGGGGGMTLMKRMKGELTRLYPLMSLTVSNIKGGIRSKPHTDNSPAVYRTNL